VNLTDPRLSPFAAGDDPAGQFGGGLDGVLRLAVQLRLEVVEPAGVIDEVGEAVRAELAAGAEVIALLVPKLALGAQAEYVVAPAESVVRAPKGAGLTAASTLLMNALTARMALSVFHPQAELA